MTQIRSWMALGAMLGVLGASACAADNNPASSPPAKTGLCCPAACSSTACHESKPAKRCCPDRAGCCPKCCQAKDARAATCCRVHIKVKKDREKELQTCLNKIVSFDFSDTPLGQVIKDLSDATGLKIVIDAPALEEAGVSVGRPMTMQLEEVDLKSALDLLLHQVHLDYVDRNGLLVVTTQAATLDKTVRCDYAFGDSVGTTQAATLDKTVRRVYPVADLVTGPKHPLDKKLVKLITRAIHPDSWSDRGGSGTIDYYPLGQALVVNQPAKIQEEIADLLATLRCLTDQPSPPPAPVAQTRFCPVTTFVTPLSGNGTHGEPVPFTQYIQQPNPMAALTARDFTIMAPHPIPEPLVAERVPSFHMNYAFGGIFPSPRVAPRTPVVMAPVTATFYAPAEPIPPQFSGPVPMTSDHSPPAGPACCPPVPMSFAPRPCGPQPPAEARCFPPAPLAPGVCTVCPVAPHPLMPHVGLEASGFLSAGTPASWTISVQGNQVVVSAPCFHASADTVTQQGNRLLLEGHIQLQYHKGGLEAKVVADRVVVGLRDGNLELAPAGMPGSNSTLPAAAPTAGQKKDNQTEEQQRIFPLWMGILR